MGFDIRFAIVDLECLEDYFSLQVSNEKSDKVSIIECTENSHFFKLYNNLKKSTIQKINRPMYVYSIDYDKTMLNALCKIVEQKNRGQLKGININKMLRDINNYLIPAKGPVKPKKSDEVHYFRLNREFWAFKDKYGKNNPTRDFADCYNYALQRIKSQYTGKCLEFIEKYHFLFGQSKVYKKLTINEVPRIYGYIIIDKEKNVAPSIGLKKLQLIKEDYNVKFNFDKYKTIKDIKDDGLYDYWIKYSKNDITFLKKLFMEKPLDDIKERIYAIRAVQKIKPDLKYTNDMIFTGTHTRLVSGVLSINNPNKKIVIDYPDYIKTNFKKFNDFVSFVNTHNNIKDDKELKKMYCTEYEVNYIEDDEIIMTDDKLESKIGSFNTLNYNGMEIKFGLGGIHGAIPDYTGENLLHSDYTSQYTSIILQYKELFKNIIDVDLYEAIYNMRIKDKANLKNMVYGSDEYNECNLIVTGLKLILNFTFGLINSNFDLPVSCKPLGRFICLKGQSLLLNLLEKLINPINVNTDGIIWKNDGSLNVETITKADGYFKLDNNKIEMLLQNNVNNYIKMVKVKAFDGTMKNKMKTKGKYNISIKQRINSDEKLSVNLENALNLFQNKEVTCEPIYFGKKINIKHGTDTPYYLTNKKQGYTAIKALKKPLILGIDDELYYFTSDKNKADINVYKHFAEMFLNKIYTFEIFTKTKKIIPYIEYPIIEDSEENNKIKNKNKLKLYRMFGSNHIFFGGFRGDLKATSFINNNPIQNLIHYKKTEIQKSTFCKGFGVAPEDKYLIIDVDIYDKKTGKSKEGYEICNDIIEALEQSNTFTCWNNATSKYGNKKYIFTNPSNKRFKINSEYAKYIELLTHKAMVWSLPNCTPTYFNNETEPNNMSSYLFNKLIK
jgi:hypothetical protein